MCVIMTARHSGPREEILGKTAWILDQVQNDE